MKVNQSNNQSARVERKPEMQDSRDQDALAEEGQNFADKLDKKPEEKPGQPATEGKTPVSTSPAQGSPTQATSSPTQATSAQVSSSSTQDPPAQDTAKSGKTPGATQAVDEKTLVGLGSHALSDKKTVSPEVEKKTLAEPGKVGDDSAELNKELPKSKTAAPPPSAGDAILAQMFGGGDQSTKVNAAAQQIGQAAGAQEVAASSGARDIGRVAEVIADRIMVSDSKFTDQKMISIKVKDDILPQTEIRISIEGKDLKIEVNTANVDSHNFLNSQKENLASHLKRTLPEHEVDVTVEMEGESSGAEGDGRSRNQRDAFEEMNEQNDDT